MAADFYGIVFMGEFNAVRERRNTHRIRKSRSDTVAGCPDSLYLLPELHGACNSGVPVTSTEVSYVTQHILEDDNSENSDFQDYFDYARTSLSITLPKRWEKAFSLYMTLMHIAVHGNFRH